MGKVGYSGSSLLGGRKLGTKATSPDAPTRLSVPWSPSVPPRIPHRAAGLWPPAPRRPVASTRIRLQSGRPPRSVEIRILMFICRFHAPEPRIWPRNATPA